MKQNLLLALTALTLASCEKAVIGTDTAETKTIRITVKDIDEDFVTRASLTDEALTDLYVYEGSTLLAHQVSTDLDFGKPSVTLTYGNHSLTFVASKSTGQSWASGQWTCTKVGDTYGKIATLNVGAGTSTSQTIELSRLNSIIRWTIEDAVPTTATQVKLQLDTYPYTLTSELNGANAQTYTATADITSWQGQTGKTAQVRLLPATYQTEGTVNATITILDDNNTTLATYTTPVPVLTNRITNIHGNFFNASEAKTITVTTDWLTQKNIDLTGTDTDATL